MLYFQFPILSPLVILLVEESTLLNWQCCWNWNNIIVCFSPGGVSLTSYGHRAASDRWPHDVLNIAQRSCNHPTIAERFLGTRDRAKPVGYIRVITRPPCDHWMVTLRNYGVWAALRHLNGDLTAFLWWLQGFIVITLRYLILWTIRLPCGRSNILTTTIATHRTVRFWKNHIYTS